MHVQSQNCKYLPNIKKKLILKWKPYPNIVYLSLNLEPAWSKTLEIKYFFT